MCIIWRIKWILCTAYLIIRQSFGHGWHHRLLIVYRVCDVRVNINCICFIIWNKIMINLASNTTLHLYRPIKVCRHCTRETLAWPVMTNIYLSVSHAKLYFIIYNQFCQSLLFLLLAKYGRLGALFNPKQPFIWPFSPGIPSDGFFPLENGEKLVTSDTNLNWSKKKNKIKIFNSKTSTTHLKVKIHCQQKYS